MSESPTNAAEQLASRISACEDSIALQWFYCILAPVVVVLIMRVLTTYSPPLQGLIRNSVFSTGQPIIDGIVLICSTFGIGSPLAWFGIFRRRRQKYLAELNRLRLAQAAITESHE